MQGGRVTIAGMNPASVDLTVAISTVGRPESLERCVAAVLAGARQPDEIVVVDQGPDDAGFRAVARAEPGSPIRYVRQEARGLSASRNAALEAATGDIVALTDDDCVPDAHWLPAIADAFAREPHPQAVTGRVLPLGPDAEGYAVSSRELGEPADFRGYSTPWRVGTGANTAVVREWAMRIGGFDDRLGVGTRGAAGEDLDFIHRLLRAGALIRFDPNAVVYHERQSAARRRETRWAYGRGVGACCALWLRQGDLGGVAVLGSWLGMRGGRLVRGALHVDAERVAEELRVLAGTAHGVAYGIRLGNRAA